MNVFSFIHNSPYVCPKCNACINVYVTRMFHNCVCCTRNIFTPTNFRCCSTLIQYYITRTIVLIHTCKTRKKGLALNVFFPHPYCGNVTYLYLSHSINTFRLRCGNETTTVKWCASYQSVLKNQIIASTSHSLGKREQKKETRTRRNFLDVSDRRQPPFNYGYLKRFVVHFFWLLSCGICYKRILSFSFHFKFLTPEISISDDGFFYEFIVEIVQIKYKVYTKYKDCFVYRLRGRHFSWFWTEYGVAVSSIRTIVIFFLLPFKLPSLSFLFFCLVTSRSLCSLHFENLVWSKFQIFGTLFTVFRVKFFHWFAQIFWLYLTSVI